MKANWFIALVPNTDTDISDLISTAPTPLRRFVRKDWHITLAFLGPCSAEDAMAAWQYACQNPPFIQTLTPCSLKAMGHPKKPSAASILFANGDGIKEWMLKYRSDILKQAKRPPAKYPPMPHLTIARPKRRAPEKTRIEMSHWCKETALCLPNMVCSKMALYTWNEDRREQLFQVIHEMSLTYGCSEENCTGHNQEWERCTTNGF